jgi:C4-dicarboxylate-specific signal transduction histidine kinase
VAHAGRLRRAEITIDVVRTDDSVVIGVGDNGPGVPEAERSRIFDPFYSTKRELAGVGLGLFVAEGLVRSAGGRLSVDQGPNGGALFEIVLRVPDPGERNAPVDQGVTVSS